MFLEKILGFFTKKVIIIAAGAAIVLAGFYYGVSFYAAFRFQAELETLVSANLPREQRFFYDYVEINLLRQRARVADIVIYDTRRKRIIIRINRLDIVRPDLFNEVPRYGSITLQGISTDKRNIKDLVRANSHNGLYSYFSDYLSSDEHTLSFSYKFRTDEVLRIRDLSYRHGDEIMGGISGETAGISIRKLQEVIRTGDINALVSTVMTKADPLMLELETRFDLNDVDVASFLRSLVMDGEMIKSIYASTAFPEFFDIYTAIHARYDFKKQRLIVEELASGTRPGLMTTLKFTASGMDFKSTGDIEKLVLENFLLEIRDQNGIDTAFAVASALSGQTSADMRKQLSEGYRQRLKMMQLDPIVAKKMDLLRDFVLSSEKDSITIESTPGRSITLKDLGDSASPEGVKKISDIFTIR